MKKHVFLTGLAVLCFSTSLYAQTRVDSLEAQLPRVEGQERLAVLVDLIETLYSNDAERAIRYGREAKRLLTAETEAALVRRLWYGTGRAHEMAVQYDSALVHTARLLAWAAEANDDEGLASGAYLEGRIHRKRGAHAAALETYEKALAGYETLGRRKEMGQVLNSMGVIYWSQSNYPEALSLFNRTLAIREKLGDKRGIASTLNNIGIIQRSQGNYPEALDFYARSLAIKEELGDKEGIAASLNNIGIIHGIQGSYAEALAAFTRSLAIEEENGDKEGIAGTLNNIGNIHRRQGNYPEALDFQARSLAIKEELGDKEGVATSLNNIGLIHESRGNYAEALDFHTRSLAIKEELGNKEGVAASLNNIGTIHRSQGNYVEALAFYTRALALEEEIGNKQGIAPTLSNIGIVYESQGNYAEALSSYSRSLAIKEELGDKAGIAASLNNIGGIHEHRGNYAQALSFYTRALAIAKEIGDKEGIASTLNNIGDLYLQQGRLDSALATTTEALSLADSIGAQSLVSDAHEQRAAILEQQERFPEALAAYKAYKAAHDSLYTTEGQSIIAELQEQYRTKEQQQQIQLLERDRRIQQLWLYGLLIGLLFIALIAFLLYNRYRLKNRSHAALKQAHHTLQQTHSQLRTTQQQLIHAEKMASLGQLTAGVAHEIKNPLNFITNFAQLSVDLAGELSEELEAHRNEPVAVVTDQVEAILSDLKFNVVKIEEHGRRADGIVRSMMQHAVGSTGDYTPTDINQLVVEQIELVYHGKQAQAPDLDVTVEQDWDDGVCTVELVPQEIARVLLNLLGNAFDAVRARAGTVNGAYTPTVTVSTRQVDDQIEIRVSDNGPGIPAEIKEKIFEPFFTTKPTGQGHTGLGLSLSYDIVRQGHGGMLEAESAEGKGATFTVTLPVNQAEAASSLFRV